MTGETEDQRFERLSRDRLQRPLPKRFYKSVTVTEKLGIALDGRNVKTPLKAPLILPNRPLADAVAAEWEAQKEFINPFAMPLTKLANNLAVTARWLVPQVQGLSQGLPQNFHLFDGV